MKLSSIINHKVFRYLLICYVFFFVMMSPEMVTSSDYCIVLKNGKKLLVDDHWEIGDKLYFETNEKEFILNKDQVLKIIDTESHDFSPHMKNSVDLSEYESDGGNLTLNNGKAINFNKSWIENNQVAVLYNNNIVLINPNDIKAIQKRKSFIERSNVDFKNIKVENPSTIREKAFYNNRTTKSLLSKIGWKKKLCDEIQSQLRDEYDGFKPNTSSVKYSNLIIKSAACQSELSEANYQMSKWAKQFYDEYDKEHQEKN